MSRKSGTTSRKLAVSIAYLSEDSAAARAYHDLEEMIVTLRLAPGAALSEEVLMNQIGVGLSPLREALVRLEREGLVLIYPRRGVMVTGLNIEKQLSLLETRREIERLLARLSARRASPAQRAGFARIGVDLRRMTEDTDERVLLHSHCELTKLKCITAENEYAASCLQLMISLSRRFWVHNHRRYANLVETAALHANVAEGISQGDATAAAAASDALIDYIEDFTRAVAVRNPEANAASS